MEWTDLLQSQQIEFIKRLQSGTENLLHCGVLGLHSDIKTISSPELQPLREHCWKMVEKYRNQNPHQVFINHAKGKLGEIVTKECLGELVGQVNYEILISGDGKIDLTLSSDGNIGIQVKTRYSNTYKVEWSISLEEIQKNKAIVCVLILGEQKDFDEFKSEYHPVMAGFLPTDLIQKQIREGYVSLEQNNGNKILKIKINNLLYGGGLHSYLKELSSQSLDEINLAHLRGEQWEILHVFKEYNVRCIDFHPNGKILASGGESRDICIWDLNTKKLLSWYKRYYYENETGDVYYLKFSCDGRFVVSTGFVSGTRDLRYLETKGIQVLEWKTGKVISFLSFRPNSIAIHPSLYNVIAFGAFINTTHKIQLYDFRSNEPLITLEVHQNYVESIAFSPNGKILVSGHGDGQVRIWNLNEEDLTDSNISSRYHSEHLKAVNTVAISPDNQILASGSDDNTIVLFNLKTKKIGYKLTGHSDIVRSICFSPDSLILASGSADDTIKLWHVKTGELLHTLRGNPHREWPKGCWSVCFSPDGQILAAGFGAKEDGIILWQRT